MKAKIKFEINRIGAIKCDNIYKNHQINKDPQYQYDDIEIISEESENEENTEAPNQFKIIKVISANQSILKP